MRKQNSCVACPGRWSKADACDCPLTTLNGEASLGTWPRTTAGGISSRHFRRVDVDAADLEVTRYLCRAAQKNEMFARMLFERIIRQPRLGIAMSPGVDLVAILRHACAARRRRALRDLALTVVNLPLMIVALGSVVAAVRFFSLEPIRWAPWALGIMVLNTTVATFVAELSFNRTMTGPLSRDRFPHDTPPGPYKPSLRRRLDYIERLAKGNISIYRGFKPFRGYGRVLGGWSFAIDVEKPRHEHGTTRPFEIHDIRQYVTAQIRALEWTGLAVEDRVFVSGRDVWKDGSFVDEFGRPKIMSDAAEFENLLNKRDSKARPYTVIRLLGWDGELALTIFLRFVIVQKNLFIEASYSILTPLQQRFHDHDEMRPLSTAGDYVLLALRSLGVFRGIVAAFGHLTEFRNDRRALARLDRVPRDHDFDHGASFSVREYASDSHYQRYFQKLDSEMYTKVVEQRIFDALVQFFDDHEIDTGELIQRQTTILNNGILVTGNSSIQADSIAAGNNAQAISHAPAKGDSGSDGKKGA